MERNEDLESTIDRLLNGPLQDEDRVLEIIVEAITAKCTDTDLVRKAVKQAVSNYENQLRVFMVAVANRQLARILRLMRSLDHIEEQIESNPSIIGQMKPNELLKLYALQQSNLNGALDYVKKVTDMRLELASAQAAITNTMTTKELDEIHTLSRLPKLNAQQRGNVRRIVEGLVADINEDSQGLEAGLAEGFLPPGKSNGERKSALPISTEESDDEDA